MERRAICNMFSIKTFEKKNGPSMYSRIAVLYLFSSRSTESPLFFFFFGIFKDIIIILILDLVKVSGSRF